MVIIVDSGTGNLRSLSNAVRACGFEPWPQAAPGCLLPECIILPGVGAFGHAASALESRGWYGYLRRAREEGVRILGICLGMQLLFDSSEESPGARGLGLLRGCVRKLDPSRAKVPHIGWGRLGFTAAEPPSPRPAWAYFVHSFAASPEDPGCVTCWADHGGAIPAVVRCGSVVGVQFHPEKSRGEGVAYLKSLLGGAP